MSKNNGKTCVFCESPETVEAKPVCKLCLKKCVTCPVDDDWKSCTRLPQTKCGGVLTEHDFSVCRNCGGERGRGNMYCSQCSPIVKRRKILEWQSRQKVKTLFKS